MPETELLNVEERKAKIRKFVYDLGDRFGEMLWNDKAKLKRMESYKPTFLEEFGKRWDELDVRCKEYLDGKIDWAGDALQMELMPLTKAPYPVLNVDRDVENYGRDLFCWFALQVKDL